MFTWTVVMQKGAERQLDRSLGRTNMRDRNGWKEGRKEVRNKKLSPSTPWRQIGGGEVQLHLFLTSIPDRGERLTACLSRLTTGKNAGTYWTGRCVSPRSGLDVLGEEKNLLTLLVFKTMIMQHVVQLLYWLCCCGCGMREMEIQQVRGKEGMRGETKMWKKY